MYTISSEQTAGASLVQTEAEISTFDRPKSRLAFHSGEGRGQIKSTTIRPSFQTTGLRLPGATDGGWSRLYKIV